MGETFVFACKSCLLAPAASTLSLQADILSVYASSDDSYFQVYLTLWSTTFGDIPDILPANSRSATALVFKLIASWWKVA